MQTADKKPLELRFRQIHLDFHTSPDIPDVGKDFDPEQFADTLAKAHVDSVTLFARCHHGMIYYDSKVNPERVHPNLVNRNLLKEQIEAVHKRGIRAPIYTTVQWDYYTAREHPDWLAIDPDGRYYGDPSEGFQSLHEPGFYQILCLNSPYREFLKEHTRELLEMFKPVDGFFFDIVFPVPCACRRCTAEMEKRGFNPLSESERMAYSQLMINTFKAEMTELVRSYQPDATIFYNRGHVGTAHRDALDAYTHFELESLPSGIWGYLHFPTTIRYARNHGLDCLSHTGKFHTMWGDFHSFKNKAALEFEVFNMLALNAKCLIGDQMDPNGRLSEAVYDLIGSVYAEVEKKEPWCRGARPVTEIGVFTPEEFTGARAGLLPESIQGAVRMLQELGMQFDVLDTRSDLSRYRLLILPDEIPVSEAFAERLSAYIRQGGAVIASFESGLTPAKDRFALNELGVRLNPEQTKDEYGREVRGKHYPRFDYTDFVIPSGDIGKGLPETEHAMYMKGLEVTAESGSTVLAKGILPYFYRTYKHFCSHRQTPSSGKPGYDAIVRNGNVIYFAHPIFRQYHQNAPRWCKVLLKNAMEMLLGDFLLRHDGPSTLLATINEQPAENRWVVHLLHYIPERRSKDIDVIEDVIPLHQVRLSVKTDRPVREVRCVPDGAVLEHASADGRVEFTVPVINGHQMVSLSF